MDMLVEFISARPGWPSRPTTRSSGFSGGAVVLASFVLGAILSLDEECQLPSIVAFCSSFAYSFLLFDVFSSKE